MQRIKNIAQYLRYDKTTNLVFHAAVGDEQPSVLVELEINPVGPCVVRAHAPDTKKGEPGESWLVGCYDSPETLRFALPLKACRVSLEAAEVWVRRPRTVSTEQNPNPDETFTRMEKQGIDMDEMSVALHRQAVFNRIAANRDMAERDAYTRQLESKLNQLSEQIATLTPPPPVDPEPKSE